ncbi:hypothetical protein A7K50_12390 [Dehalobacter sp. MCB1]|uniref:hypothetical protein n=1 Tax=Dehalobacter sp. MCB1 TaxID=1844756 RepID=UPI000E6BA17C|nr:hypothetical protein [Dehalobacter sp. MCB1]RJE46817.1 hypothetical protein A7K50_12390 [Dehalobacter sp. MCB1]
MPRPCGPCGDKRRNELDRRLLEMEISGETYRGISQDFGYSEDALRRHKLRHLIIDLSEIKQAKEEARVEAHEKVKAEELEQTKADVKECMATRLENAANFFDQLKEIRAKAASLLDQAEGARDLRAAGTFLKELRETIRLWAELEGQLPQTQITIVNNPEWVELRAVILTALDDFPEAKKRVIDAIRK